MKGPEQLLEYEDNWSTRMGLAFPGERVVFRGKDLLNDLKDMRWMGLLLYGITGRILDDKQIKLFEGMWVLSSSYPDPRLWNNRVASLAGTARSTSSLGASAAIAISEASIYGRRPDIRSFDLIKRIKEKLDSGGNLKALVLDEFQNFRSLPGYGRPIVNGDERIRPVLDMAKRLGFAEGLFVRLAFEIEEILICSRYRMRMNVAMLDAALAADQGLSVREYYHYTILCFSGGILPCVIEALEKPEGSFLPIRCDRVTYDGKPRRLWI
jgi:hypothetical protein